MKENYFKNCKTLEELKKSYRDAMKKWHPDISTEENAEEMAKKINNDYDYMFNIVKNIRKNKDGEFYEKETNETPEQFKNIINDLIKCNVKIEIIGVWLWVSGNTFPIKKKLIENGLKYSSRKKAWYIHFDAYRKKTKKVYDLDDLRRMFKVEEIENEISDLKLASNY